MAATFEISMTVNLPDGWTDDEVQTQLEALFEKLKGRVEGISVIDESATLDMPDDDD